ncbi:MAG TPA: membrane protein insertase YidC [Gammaproteobacteria bacterium]|nr:membrane protein insertase YidC [Gammaproteobacteria bacterium]
MDNIRVFLWLTLLGMAWLTYTAWNADYAVTPDTAPPPPVAGPDNGAPDTSLPTLAPSPDQPAQAPQIAAPAPTTGELIRVRTDVLDVRIASQGGDLVRADLLQYRVSKNEPEPVVRLLDDMGPERWVFQTGLRSAVGGAEPNHLATFRTASSDYTLAPGQDELVVTLDWVGEGPISARKTYTFRRGQYEVDLTLTVTPTSGASWRGAPYAQMERVHVPIKRSYLSIDSYSFKGPVLYDGDQFEKLDVQELAETPLTENGSGGWFASIQHHFLAAAVPPSGETYRYDAAMRGPAYLLSAIGPVADVSTGSPLNATFKLFVGPKLQEQLQSVGNDLERTVDYGKTTLLAQPLFFLLATVERWVGNWGFAIILVTILIKAVFYKLTAMSGRSMAKMRKIAPRMKALQERYKDDRQGLSQAMMELYKKEKVNPAAGCLPILIQMPFFFAFYWVLVESVEMRQAPFMLWIHDLSARDPFYVLPVLMGTAMFFQTRLSPAPPDPVQARMMQIMPIMFAALLIFLPAGLVAYQLTNTVLSILQQWRINKIVARESAAT